MTPAEFAFWFIYLPWATAIVGAVSTVFLLIYGGKTLRTLVSAKLNPSAQLVLSYSEGGLFQLESRSFRGEHGLLQKGATDFMLVNTPPNQVQYDPQLVALDTSKIEGWDKLSETEKQSYLNRVSEENRSRIEEASAKTEEFTRLSETSKMRGVFEGKPIWIGHQGLGVAVNPDLLKKMQDSKIKVGKNAKVSKLTPLSIDVIKDYLTMNFSRKRLESIYRCGVDEGKYGRPKQPMNPMFFIILAGAALLVIVGVLIITGKLDLGGFMTKIGLDLGRK